MYSIHHVAVTQNTSANGTRGKLTFNKSEYYSQDTGHIRTLNLTVHKISKCTINSLGKGERKKKKKKNKRN